jgi:DNA-binding HxlR family transcriptional regulator
MEDQTRQLLRLLADDFTDWLIAELRVGGVLITDLQAKAPESRQTLVRRLKELQAWGITVSERRATPGRVGRPPHGRLPKAGRMSSRMPLTRWCWT